MPQIEIVVTSCKTVDAHPSGPAAGVLHPGGWAPEDDPDVVLFPARAGRGDALKFLDLFAAAPPRGVQPHRMIDLLFVGPGPLDEVGAWPEDEARRWGEAAVDAVAEVFAPDGPVLFLEAALYLRPGRPVVNVKFVPRVKSRGGRLRVSWTGLLKSAAAGVAGLDVADRRDHPPLVLGRLKELLGGPFDLDESSGGRAALGVYRELRRLRAVEVKYGELEVENADLHARVLRAERAGPGNEKSLAAKAAAAEASAAAADLALGDARQDIEALDEQVGDSAAKVEELSGKLKKAEADVKALNAHNFKLLWHSFYAYSECRRLVSQGAAGAAAGGEAAVDPPRYTRDLFSRIASAIDARVAADPVQRPTREMYAELADSPDPDFSALFPPPASPGAGRAPKP